MATKRQDELPEEHYVRHKLYGGGRSVYRRYAELVVGEAGFWQLLKYELITGLLSWVPGALGLALRKVLYPLLFRQVGKGTIFGRNVVLRNANRVTLGRRVMIDDECLIDARGAGDEGIVIGDEVIVNRRVSIQAKIGPITIKSRSDIGADSTVISQGGTHIGDEVTMGGGCKVGGGSVRLEDTASTGESGHDFGERAQRRFTRGPVRIESRCIFGRLVTVMDGVCVGAGSVVGAGAFVREDVPPDSVVMPYHKLVVVSRSQFRQQADDGATLTSAASPEIAGQGSPTSASAATTRARDSIDRARVLAVVYAVLDELNGQLPPERQVEKASEAPLAEPAGPLDSLGVINLIVTAEQMVEEEFGSHIDLASFQGVPVAEGPLASVDRLVTHVQALLSGAELTAR